MRVRARKKRGETLRCKISPKSSILVRLGVLRLVFGRFLARAVAHSQHVLCRQTDQLYFCCIVNLLHLKFSLLLCFICYGYHCRILIHLILSYQTRATQYAISTSFMIANPTFCTNRANRGTSRKKTAISDTVPPCQKIRKRDERF